MRRELIIKSRGLAGTSDLTLLAPIRKGLVPSLDSISHKTRIRRLLQTLGAGRSLAQEYALMRPFSDAVERVGKIHSVRVAVLEPENKVLLAVTFDGTWESYIRVLWQKVGTLLDIIFFDTEDYVSAYDNRFEKWEEWARRVQVESHFFYSTPLLTVDDVDYLRHEERQHRIGEDKAALNATRYAVRPPEDLSWKVAAKTSARTTLETLKQGLEALAALYRLADLYLPDTEDGKFLHRAARNLLLEFVRLIEDDEFPVDLVELARVRFDKQLAWLTKEPAPPRDRRPPPALPAPTPEFDRSEVQGGIVTSFDGATHGCLMLIAIEDPGKAVDFFRQLSDAVTRENTELAQGVVAVTVALTYEGLRAAGLTEDELALFPEEFRQGMEARCGVLGDIRINHPRRWRLPVSVDDGNMRVELAAVHLVLQLRLVGGGKTLEALALQRNKLDESRDQWKKRLTPGTGLRLLAVQPLERHFDEQGKVIEHFGFADGESDPSIEPKPSATTYPNQIHLGDILVCYSNEADPDPDLERGVDAESERLRHEWLRNGSFLVIRKLSQDCAALESAIGTGPDAEKVLEKMMGRTKSGNALALPAGGNDFDYRKDAEGQLCPFHAHIRRANPRVPPAGSRGEVGRRVPRIVRRGMSFGPRYVRDEAKSADAERGLVFMTYNADIGEQFEVVQRWISGGNSTGGYSGQSDPFLGVAENGVRRYFRFEDEGKTVRSVALDGSAEALGERKPFVRLDWGAYLFAPSMTALRRIRDRLLLRGRRPEPPWSPADGAKLIDELRAAETEAPRLRDKSDLWKTALEDSLEIEKFRSASIWSAIRERHGGVLRTPYGVLVASRTLAMQVLGDGKTYSVRGYAERLNRSIGSIYLGDDESPQYRAQADVVNAAIMSIRGAAAFVESRGIARQVLGGFLENARKYNVNPVQPDRWELILEIKEVIDQALGELCKSWFGLRDSFVDAEGNGIRLAGSRWDADPKVALFPGHFTAPSRFVFQPEPGESAEQYGCDYGRVVTKGFGAFLRHAIRNGEWPASSKPGSPAPIAEAVYKVNRKAIAGGDFDQVTRTLVGAMMGFLPTVDGNLRRSLNEWLYEGTFWSLRAQWRAVVRSVDEAALFGEASSVLAPVLVRTMQLRPSPELVWRTATQKHSLGGVEIEKDEKVVVSIVSAAQECLAAADDDHYVLFGGNRRSEVPHPTHACPGYEAAMGVLLGFIAALLEVDDEMRPSAVPLALTFEGPLVVERGEAPPSERKKLEDLRSSPSATQNRKKLAALLGSTEPSTPPSLTAAPRRQRIAGIGDSWLHYFALDVFDVLNETFDAKSFAREGTGLLTLQADPAQQLALDEWLQQCAADRVRPAAIVVSAGGNDVIRSNLGEILSETKPPDAAHAAEGLDAYKAKQHIGDMKVALVELIKQVKGLCTLRLGCSVPIILHGYAYPHPDGRGTLGTVHGLGEGMQAWLGPEFVKKGYDEKHDQELARAVMAVLIDKLNEMQLEVVAKQAGDVLHVDVRHALEDKCYRTNWGNELHPTDLGFRVIADKIAARIPKAAALS